MTDADLLQAYAATRSEDAFRALIDRYVRLVYSACWRQLKDPHLAEDAAQAVFILLSQKAAKLRPDRISGWLLTAARYACANIRKTERRRRRREEIVAMQSSSADAQPELHESLALLDEALAHLNALDREALILRYLRNLPLRDVGQALGISEEAARKRVDRGIDKVRRYFARRGVATTAAHLAAVIPAGADAAAFTPALQSALTVTILHTVAAGAASTARAAAIAKGTQTMMLHHTLKTAGIIAIGSAALLATGWWILPRATHAEATVPIAAAAPPTATVTLDFSTPEKTLESYSSALRAGDRAAAYACTTIDPAHVPAANDAFMTLNLAQNRLINAAARAFNTNGEEARQFPTVNQILDQVLAYDRAHHQAAVIDGNTAALPFELPEKALAALPADIRAEVQNFVNHPIRFIKQGNDWKLGHPGNNDVTTNVAITLLDTNNQPVTDPRTQIDVINEYAAIYDRIAAKIEADDYTDWNEASAAFKTQKSDLHKAHNLSDIEIQLTPGHLPSTTAP